MRKPLCLCDLCVLLRLKCFFQDELNAFLATVHPEVVGSGARRSRRFSRRTPVGPEDFSVFSAATLTGAKARAPNGSKNFGMHGSPMAHVSNRSRLRLNSS